MPSVPAINFEIGIKRKNPRLVMFLGHSHKTCIGEIHRDAGITLHQQRDGFCFPSQLKWNLNYVIAH